MAILLISTNSNVEYLSNFIVFFSRLNNHYSTIFIRSHIFSRGLNIYLYFEDLQMFIDLARLNIDQIGETRWLMMFLLKSFRFRIQIPLDQNSFHNKICNRFRIPSRKDWMSRFSCYMYCR
jgi:hypothetical protein